MCLTPESYYATDVRQSKEYLISLNTRIFTDTYQGSQNQIDIYPPIKCEYDNVTGLVTTSNRLSEALFVLIMTSISSTYLLPAVLLNPIVILHGLNTIASRFISSPLPGYTSNHQWLENLGPAMAIGPYFNIHDNEQLCWGYTIIMVLMQILAYGKVNDTRVRKKSAKAAAKAERERKAAQKGQMAASEICKSLTTNGHISQSDGTHDSKSLLHNGATMNGRTHLAHGKLIALPGEEEPQVIEDSTTETSSEEETIV